MNWLFLAAILTLLWNIWSKHQDNRRDALLRIFEDEIWTPLESRLNRLEVLHDKMIRVVFTTKSTNNVDHQQDPNARAQRLRRIRDGRLYQCFQALHNLSPILKQRLPYYFRHSNVLDLIERESIIKRIEDATLDKDGFLKIHEQIEVVAAELDSGKEEPNMAEFNQQILSVDQEMRAVFGLVRSRIFEPKNIHAFSKKHFAKKS